ncbi:MAG: HEPN domain-containing protein [Myxococcaceae bacterium]
MQVNRASDWLDQAKNDLAFANSALEAGFFSQCCFVAQQCAEKALKALALRQGAKAAFTHSLLKLVQALSLNGEIERAAQKLDFYYISARYPDAFPEGAPYKMFRREDAVEALGWATQILQRVETTW